MYRIFNNPSAIPRRILQLRLKRHDQLGVLSTYESHIGPAGESLRPPLQYIEIESNVSSAILQAMCESPLTDNEVDIMQRITDAYNDMGIGMQLRNLTTEQIEKYIDVQITDINTAKSILKIITRMLVAVRDEVWPDMAES